MQLPDGILRMLKNIFAHKRVWYIWGGSSASTPYIPPPRQVIFLFQHPLFVTICAKDREPFFGEVVDREMHLSMAGPIVAQEWTLTEHIHFNVRLDELVTMLNCIHRIILIQDNDSM
jgi:hypothetical protein